MDDWLVKEIEIPDPRFGTYPGSRKIPELIKKGILVLDKPSGPSSHQVAAWVKDILGIKKAGHGGTLDPKVTGVLAIALENSTKIMPALMGLSKEYVALMKLHSDVSDEKLGKIVEKFKGKIEQLPPVKSAVKRAVREKEVFALDVLEKKEREVLLKISCEAGTYIRKLISDMGKDLGGAHMQELRRTKAGPFSENESFTLQEVKDAFVLWKEEGDEHLRDIILPVEQGVEHLKKIIIKDTAVNAVCNGAPLGIGGISRFQKGISKDELVAVFSLKGELVALGKAKKSSEDILNSHKKVAFQPGRVIMEKDTYPSSWK